MKKGVVSRPGIDTDARWWDYSHTKERWVSGYKLHLTSATTTDVGEIVIPLTAEDVTTTANVQDNQIYVTLVSSSSSVFLLPTLRYMISDPMYDAKKLYEYSKKTLEIDLVFPL